MTSNTPAYTGTISRRFPLGQSRSWKFFGVLALLFFGSTAIDGRVVQIDVGDGWNGNAGRLDHVDGMDANAGTDLGRGGGSLPWNVDCDDGGNDAAIIRANTVAISRSRSSRRRNAQQSADLPVRARLFSAVECAWDGRVFGGDAARSYRNAPSVAGTLGSACHRSRRSDRRSTPVHQRESAPSCLLPRDAEACMACPRGVAQRAALRVALLRRFRRIDSDPSCPGRDGFTGNGSHYRGNHG